MKIIHLIETLAVEGGGGDRACLELASAQCALCQEVIVICFQDRDETPMTAAGVNIQRFDRSDRVGLRQAIAKACSTGGDVVHVHGAWRLLQTWARRICKRHHTPYVFQPHGLFSEERLVHKRFRKQIWFNLFERSNLRNAAAIIAESRRDRESLSRFVETKHIYEIPCGGGLTSVSTETETFDVKYSSLKDREFILYFGRLDFHKGIDILIAAYAALPWLKETYDLAIIGPDFNNTLSKLKAQVRNLGLSSVHFFDKVTKDSEKASLFDAAGAFVLPSRDENFGITVLEALSRCCPVLVSKATAWAEIEALGVGFVFEPEQKSLEAALTRYHELSIHDKQRLRNRGSVFAAEYDWSKIAASSINCYKRILND